MQNREELIPDTFDENEDLLIETVNFGMYDFKVILDGKKLNLDVSLYIDIIKNYIDYLKVIDYFGGFMLYNHMYDFFGEYYEKRGFGTKRGKTKIFEDIKKMEKLELIRTENVEQYYYVILSKRSLIYLRRRNNVPYIAKPSAVALMANAYIFDIALNNNNFYTLCLDNYERFIGSNAGRLYKTLLEDTIANNIIEYSFQEVNKTQSGLVSLKNPLYFKDYLKEQLVLSSLEHKKTTKTIEAKKKGKDEKTKINHVRVTKKYDDITRLITKHIYYQGFNKLEDGRFLLHFIILDIKASLIWIRNVLKEIDLLLNKLNAESKIPKIVGNVIIYTKDQENKERLSMQIKKLTNEFDKNKQNLIKRCTVADSKRYYLVPRYNRSALFHIVNVSVNHNNTNRFFTSKNDVVNRIKEDELSVVKIKR